MDDFTIYFSMSKYIYLFQNIKTLKSTEFPSISEYEYTSLVILLSSWSSPDVKFFLIRIEASKEDWVNSESH